MDDNGKDGTEQTSSDAILRDFRYKIQCLLMETTRDLKVRPLSIFFEPTSVYGLGEGYHSALLVTSKDKNNYFWRSSVWKSGVVSQVSMLPRQLGLDIIIAHLKSLNITIRSQQ